MGAAAAAPGWPADGASAHGAWADSGGLLPNAELRGSVRRSSKEAAAERAMADNPGDLRDFYEIGQELGVGSWGAVSRAKRRGSASGAVYAVKSVAKAPEEDVQIGKTLSERLHQSRKKNISRLKQEIAILKTMDHVNIVQLVETFEDEGSVHLVMELCRGGEVIDYILQTGHFTEGQAACLMQQVFRATHYMHGKRVCHRDLKPENILLLTRDPLERNTLKVVDFGVSCTFKPGQELRTPVGTVHYISPQVLNGRYDNSADLWSCGVILYVLLCGYPPFRARTEEAELALVRRGNYVFNPADWVDVSEDAKRLIRRLLKMNPGERCTAEQALEEPWVRGEAAKRPQVQLRSALERMHRFRHDEFAWMRRWTGILADGVSQVLGVQPVLPGAGAPPTKPSPAGHPQEIPMQAVQGVCGLTLCAASPLCAPAR